MGASSQSIPAWQQRNLLCNCAECLSNNPTSDALVSESSVSSQTHPDDSEGDKEAGGGFWGKNDVVDCVIRARTKDEVDVDLINGIQQR